MSDVLWLARKWIECDDAAHAVFPNEQHADVVYMTARKCADEVVRLAAELERAVDHTLLLAAMGTGKVRWEAWDDARGEVACAGLRYATALDPFGCPVLTDRLRAELRKAVGL